MQTSTLTSTVHYPPSLYALQLHFATIMPAVSGPAWVSQFPTSISIADLALPFRTNVSDFIGSLRAAGANVAISATLRPPERAYLMHYAFRIAREGMDPTTTPAMGGVDIDWVHRDRHGKPDISRSRAAAVAMVNGFQIVFRPALASNHTRGLAIDMTISNYLNRRARNAQGSLVEIRSEGDLHAFGASSGVRKLASDPPHWSHDGH